MEGFVYLLESNGLYKVGKTEELTKRFSQYFYHNPFINKIFILVTQDPERLENYFLRIFDAKRIDIARDWFILTKSDVDLFINYVENESDLRNYKPIQRTREKTSRNDALIRKILEFIELQSGEVNQSQIRAAMRAEGYGETSIRNTIADMETRQLISFRNGNNCSKLYSSLRISVAKVEA